MARYLLSSLAVVCCVVSISPTTNAQSRPRKPPAEGPDKPTAAKAVPEDDPAGLKEARLAFAIQVVSSLADEARGYKQESLRVEVQARAADVLWNVDRARARTLFVRAWEAAETVDDEGRRRNQEARERALSRRGGPAFIPEAPNLRAEVLRLASLHDRSLAEDFLAKMEEKQGRDEKESKESKPWDPTEPPDAIAKRLQLAQQVLENGESDKALLFAGPALKRITSPGLMFLVLLREKNAALADQLFGGLLERTTSDPTADATSVSLLSSYVFTPSVLVTATRNGVLVRQWAAPRPPPQLSPALRAQFFNAASQVLLRPTGPPELAITSAGLAGTYFTIERLLPLFEQNDPNMAAALQSRLNTLAEGRTDLIPEQHRALINAGLNAKEKKESDDYLAQIERTPSTRERDHLYAMAASAAVKKDDPKARELMEKIDDSALKTSVRTFIDFILLGKFLEKRDSERALKLARTGELSHFQRAWAYLEIAALLKLSAPEQAVDLISEATTEAERITVTSAESAQAWVAIARRGAEVTPSRKWTTVLDAIKAVNKAPGYTGDEHELLVRFQSRNNIEMMPVPAPSISLVGLFETLADEDIFRAADLARSITNESPRAIALLACARSAFEKAGRPKP